MTSVEVSKRRQRPDGAWIGPQDPEVYAFLLGLYLGDGCITVPPRGRPRIVLSLDEGYPEIIDFAERCLDIVFPDSPASRLQRTGHFTVSKSDSGVLTAFPQHGPGKKHMREIRLTKWQLEVTESCPEAFIAGLINSDGSRCLNTFSTKLPSGRVAEYSYPRYFFTNYSGDIRQLFIDHCELIGVRCTQSSFKNISVAHRDSVARLDEFIGPKR
ncbi:MAG TPA: hypothetical protein VD766_01460 [Solirubrobacterales bacterium]|nr:hypothetical protein [Solirubrobacterales bacterium]